MNDQASGMKLIAEMNQSPLQQHALMLLWKAKQPTTPTSLYLIQAAELIPQLVELDENRTTHQRLLQMLEELPSLHPNQQMSLVMGLHPSSTESDLEEMTDEMMSVMELDELALLIADNLLGVLSR